MFRAEPLVKIRLHILASEAADAALELARFGIYSPARHAPERLPENPAAVYREAWLEVEARTAKLVERCGDLSSAEHSRGRRGADPGRSGGTQHLAEGGMEYLPGRL